MKTWSLESCSLAASGFKTRRAWKLGDPNSYNAAGRNGWRDECCAHMVPGIPGARSGERTMSQAGWVARANAVHSGKYDYTKSVYKGSSVKLVITCVQHGDFEQVANSHLLGNGCKQCGTLRSAESRTGRKTGKPSANALDTVAFVEKANLVHGGRFDYSLSNYVSNKQKVEIVCPEHGPFWQKPDGHLCGKGCRRCAQSGPSDSENQLFDLVRSMCPDAVQSHVGLLDGYQEIDIFIPSKNIGFEFNGLIWHSSRFNTERAYHQHKTDAAALNGVRLIHIWADEWKFQREWVEAFVRNVLLGSDVVIGARKCDLVPVDRPVANAFHERYHLQGARTGLSVGLLHAGELLAVATVSGGELARWTVKHGVTVSGGLSRCCKWFGKKLFSYCDTAKHTGAGYLGAGWTLVSRGHVGYHYTDGHVRKNRIGFQKHKLLGRGDCIGDTEAELAASIGFYQIGGCRQLKFEFDRRITS